MSPASPLLVSAIEKSSFPLGTSKSLFRWRSGRTAGGGRSRATRCRRPRRRRQQGIGDWAPDGGVLNCIDDVKVRDVGRHCHLARRPSFSPQWLSSAPRLCSPPRLAASDLGPAPCRRVALLLYLDLIFRVEDGSVSERRVSAPESR
jgi:hypothetical protein